MPSVAYLANVYKSNVALHIFNLKDSEGSIELPIPWRSDAIFESPLVDGRAIPEPTDPPTSSIMIQGFQQLTAAPLAGADRKVQSGSIGLIGLRPGRREFADSKRAQI